MRLSLLLALTAAPLLAEEKHPFARGLGELVERLPGRKAEWAQMAASLLKGEGLDGEKGWWRPAQRRLGWSWLRTRFDSDGNGRIEAAELPGASRYFEALDADRDGVVTEADFDPSRWGRGRSLANALFRRLDADSNGRISKEELSSFFERADTGNLGYVTREDLALALLEREEAGGSSEGMPSPWLLVTMLLSGQLGSVAEGPQLGEAAPEIRLETKDGEEHRLSDSRGKRPVVLIFGSFT